MNRDTLRAFIRDLDRVGLAALGLLAATLFFLVFVLRPLEARKIELEDRFASHSTARGTGSSVAQAADKLAGLYRFLETKEQPAQLLARLHSAGAAAGVELRAAEYRLQKTGTRIERYEITLPVTGSYNQIRTFIGGALKEIPALSLDQVTFRRQRPEDTQVQAEVRVTLHLVKP